MTSQRGARKRARGSASDIAQALGVSRAAVSYALNGKPGVSDETRKEILNLARTYGIEIPERAVTEKTVPPVVGLVLADLANPFYQQLGLAVSEEARAHGFNAMLAHTWDSPTELLPVVESMIHHNVDGVILTATQDGDARVAQLLRSARVPYVQVSRKMPTIRACFVGIDNKNAAKELALHMVEHGYKNIALAIGTRRSSASNERYAGYLEGLIESGLSIPSEWIVRTDLGPTGGVTAARYFRSIKRGLPEAIMCGSDAIAYAMIDDFAEQGIRVPEDVAICGFDGVAQSKRSQLSLTTIVQPIRKMAQESVDLLEKLITNEKICQRDVTCRFELRVGNSCGCTHSI